jgi:hypothetical protein
VIIVGRIRHYKWWRTNMDARQTRDYCVAKDATPRGLAQILRHAKDARLRMTRLFCLRVRDCAVSLER